MNLKSAHRLSTPVCLMTTLILLLIALLLPTSSLFAQGDVKITLSAPV